MSLSSLIGLATFLFIPLVFSEVRFWEFPGGPEAKTLYFQYRGPGQGTRSHVPQPRSYAAKKKKDVRFC